VPFLKRKSVSILVHNCNEMNLTSNFFHYSSLTSNAWSISKMMLTVPLPGSLPNDAISVTDYLVWKKLARRIKRKGYGHRPFQKTLQTSKSK
jgi:hypothetical protein